MTQPQPSTNILERSLSRSEKIVGFIVAVIALVGNIGGVLKIAQNTLADRFGIVLLIVGNLLWIASGILLLRARIRTVFLTSSDRPFLLRRFRKFVVLATAAIPLGSGFFVRMRYLHEKEMFRIVIAAFDARQEADYRLRDNVLSTLRNAFRGDSYVNIIALGEPITERDGVESARRIGRANRADVVIWGWYAAPRDTADVRIHVEVLDTNLLEDLLHDVIPAGPGGMNRIVPVSQLASFEFQNAAATSFATLAYFLRGMKHYSAANFSAAIPFFNAAIRKLGSAPLTRDLLPRPGAIYLYRGNALYSTGALDAALSSYDTLIRMEPRKAQGHAMKAVILLDLRHFGDAVAAINAAIRLDSSSSVNYVTRGIAFAEIGDYDRARDDFDIAVRLDTTSIVAYLNRAVLELQTGDRRRAFEDAETAINLDRKEPQAYQIRGSARMLNGDSKGAIEDLNTAIRLSPAPEFYASRAGIWMMLGESERADEDMRFAADNGRHATYEIGYAILCAKAGELWRALTYANRAVIHDSASWEAFYTRAAIRNALRRRYANLAQSSPVEDYSRAISLKKSGLYQLYVARAEALYAEERPFEALLDLNRAVMEEPALPKAYVWRGRLLRQLGWDPLAAKDETLGFLLGGANLVTIKLAEELHERRRSASVVPPLTAVLESL